MADDMNSALDTIKGLLGDNADEKLRSVIDSLSSGGSNSGGTVQEMPADLLNDNNMQYILQMKNIIDQMNNSNDARSNLLMSLKPYMRGSRQQSIDSALRLLSLTKLSGLFKGKF